jgi:hypothetical protein
MHTPLLWFLVMSLLLLGWLGLLLLLGLQLLLWLLFVLLLVLLFVMLLWLLLWVLLGLLFSLLLWLLGILWLLGLLLLLLLLWLFSLFCWFKAIKNATSRCPCSIIWCQAVDLDHHGRVFSCPGLAGAALAARATLCPCACSGGCQCTESTMHTKFAWWRQA